MFVTWRLAGTFPAFQRCAGDGHAFAACDLLLDQTRSGPQWLRRPEVARCVVINLRDGAGFRYQLHSYVVMPNHVHLLLTPWIDESFDHWIRYPQQFEKVRAYIERNPVRAGLVERPGQWPYSSASRPQAEACATILPSGDSPKM